MLFADRPLVFFLKLYHFLFFLKKAITYNLKVHFDIKKMKTSCSSLNINGIFSKYISKWPLHLAQFSPPTTTSCFLPVLIFCSLSPILKSPSQCVHRYWTLAVICICETNLKTTFAETGFNKQKTSRPLWEIRCWLVGVSCEKKQQQQQKTLKQQMAI